MSEDEPTPMRVFSIYCGQCRDEFIVPDDEIPDGAIWYCARCSTTQGEEA